MARTPLVGTLMTCALLGALAACGDNSTAPNRAGSAPPPGAGASQPGAAVPPGQASSNLPDPCTLITRAQAEQAMGKPAAGAGKAEDGSTDRKCTYDAQDGSASVSLSVDSEPAVLKAAMQAAPQPISGLGDEAIFEPGLEVLFVRKGNVAFTVQFVSAAGAPGSGKDALVQLATGVLAKL